MVRSIEINHPNYSCRLHWGSSTAFFCASELKTAECQFRPFVIDRKNRRETLDRFEPYVVAIEACSQAGVTSTRCYRAQSQGPTRLPEPQRT